MTTTGPDINQKRGVSAYIRVIQDLFANGEPVSPVRPISSLSFHETVEPSQRLRVLTKPGETVCLEIIGVLEGSEQGVIRIAIVGGFEVLGSL
jgi:hypothetical protein